MANILIIDDDKGMCFTLTELVKHTGHEATCAYTLSDGLNKAYSGSFDVVFLDVMFPDGNGLNVMHRVREAPSAPEVIIITSRGDPDGAELAIKSGAWDYIQKPSSIKEIKLQLLRSLQYREEKRAKKPPVALKREAIVGSSPQMRACLDILAQAAVSDGNILITGETGTGKELFALAIHHNSSRLNKNFVIVDCAALPETLVESLLFGHEKGAFTGASKTQEGLIKQADGGTLFLDEVGELPMHVQKAFLRSLQEHRFRPLGGKREIKSDFRLVAATNRDLDKLVRHGHFRKELLFRLRSLALFLPPLRERPKDIKELAMYHVTRLSDHYGTGTKGFSPEFFDTLAAYDWPGNVRELFNALERAISAAHHEPTLFPTHLPTHIRIKIARASIKNKDDKKRTSKGISGISGPPPELRDFRETMEKKYLQDLHALTNGNIKEACRISGLSRSRLYVLMKKYEISNLA